MTPAVPRPDGVVVAERRGAITLLTLNRPEVRNAVNIEAATRLGALLEQAEQDPQVRVIVLTGTGDAFSAGADLKASATRRPYSAEHPEWGFAGFIHHPLTKPVVAAVNGSAVGGGTELVLAADLAVASDRATFALPEVRRGLVAAAGGVVRLPLQVPPKVAMAMVLTGRPISAAEALGWGLVSSVVPHRALLDEAMAMAEEIAGNAPLAVQGSKRILRLMIDGRSGDEALGWDLNDQVADTVRRSADAREGIRAFVERRPPEWRGE